MSGASCSCQSPKGCPLHLATQVIVPYCYLMPNKRLSLSANLWCSHPPSLPNNPLNSMARCLKLSPTCLAVMENLDMVVSGWNILQLRAKVVSFKVRLGSGGRGGEQSEGGEVPGISFVLGDLSSLTAKTAACLHLAPPYDISSCQSRGVIAA